MCNFPGAPVGVSSHTQLHRVSKGFCTAPVLAAWAVRSVLHSPDLHSASSSHDVTLEKATSPHPASPPQPHGPQEVGMLDPTANRAGNGTPNGMRKAVKQTLPLRTDGSHHANLEIN